MKRIFAVMALLTTSAFPLVGFAKGNLVRIEVVGANLGAPLVVSDADTLKQLFIWSGPGAGQPIGSPQSADSGSFIDWHTGIANDVPKGMDTYDVYFFCVFDTQKPDGSLTYSVKYAFDPSTNRGYIYLPGPREKNYGINVSTVFHDVEGHWFNASNRWESLVAPLIRERAVQRVGEVAAAH
ncbi:MAG TPA: hypothetical protein VEW08_07205 [Steroidobacteraceae bacterium]|nr:hypothetical protein [Steroidobacteraceae bacterium]